MSGNPVLADVTMRIAGQSVTDHLPPGILDLVDDDRRTLRGGWNARHPPRTAPTVRTNLVWDQTGVYSPTRIADKNATKPRVA